MTIVVQCPHCETKFNLQPEMMGKTMRCPNLECRQVFPVKDQPLPVEPPPLPPEPEPDEPATPAKSRKKTDKPRRPSKPAVVDAEIVEAAVVSPPKTKEVVWSAGTAIPPPPKAKEVMWSEGASAPSPPRNGKSAPRRKPRPAKDFIPIRRRKKKKNVAPILLIGGVVLIVLVGGAAALWLIRAQDISEQQASEKAEKDYKNQDFAAAGKDYEALAKDYPDGENAPKYQFFAKLCEMRVAVNNVTSREQPEIAYGKFQEFAKSQESSPFAKHTTGYGHDILEAGKKLAEDITGHVNDRITAYKADRSGKGAEDLPRAEKAIAMGKSLLLLLERYRSGDDTPLTDLRNGFLHAEADIKHEHDRIAAIAKARKQLETISDAMIERTKADLEDAGFLSDPEALALIAEAKGKLQALVVYEKEIVPPLPGPPGATASLLFVTPIGNTTAPPKDVPSSVFLAVARGILYAIDEHSGNLSWAVRVGPEISDPPTIARVETNDGILEAALVTSNVNGEPALAAYLLRDGPFGKAGQPLWYQRLPAPAAGAAVVVGTRAFIAVRDSLGSIYEFDLLPVKGEPTQGGTRKGRIRLGQPAGPGLTVRPGTGLIYAVAEARRIFVIDVSLRDEDNNLKPAQCVQVIATGHPGGAIRTPPLIIGPEGLTPDDKWMLLSQSDGSNGMKLRVYPILKIDPPAADAKPPAEVLATPAAELSLKGWAWYPPASDGERLAVVSDAGQFRLFEVRQPGTLDRPLFSLPDPKLPETKQKPAADGSPIRGIAFPGEEAAFWSLANGMLQKYVLGLNRAQGIELRPSREPIPLGEATQPPQFNLRKDSVCLVVRSPSSNGFKAVLLNLRDGAFRWQRQLGVVPSTAAIRQGDRHLLVARDGGILSIPQTAGPAGAANATPASWVIATPPLNVTSATAVAASADGKTVYTLTQTLVTEDLKQVSKFLIRRVVGGKVEHEGTVIARAELAGPPVVLGETLLVPLRTGIVCRHVPGKGFVDGALWSARVEPGVKCYITPLQGDSFLTSDGTKTIAHWDWPADGSCNKTGEWDLRDQPTGPGLILPPVGNAPPRLMMADASGSVTLFPNEQGGIKIARRWRPSAGLPPGKPTSPLTLQLDASGKPVVAYVVDEKVVVCIDPDGEKHLWDATVRPKEDVEGTIVGSPQPLGMGRWAVTDLGGRITILDADGKPAGTANAGLPGAVPAVASTPLGAASLLAPLTDGSAVVLPLPNGMDAKE